MLAMTDINTIRNLRNNHDKSIQHIADELEINWRTAKKYADENLLPEPKVRKNTGEASLLSGFLKILSCRRRSAGPLTL